MLKIGSAPYLSVMQYWPGAIGETVCVPVYIRGNVIGWGNGTVQEMYTPGKGLPVDSNVNDSYVVVQVPTYSPALYFAHNIMRALHAGGPQWFAMSEIELTDPDPTNPLRAPQVLGKDRVLPSFDKPESSGPMPPHDVDAELDADTVSWLGLDPTGRNGNERFPFTWAKLTADERARLLGQQPAPTLPTPTDAELLATAQRETQRLREDLHSAQSDARMWRAATDEAKKDHVSDIKMISDSLIETADRHEWCGEFDKAVRRLNHSLHVALEERKRIFKVTARVEVVAEVEATDETSAYAAAETIFRQAEQAVDRIEGTDRRSDWDYSYEISSDDD